MTVLTIARGTVIQSLRDRVLYLPILFVLFILMGSLFLGSLSLGNMQRLVVDFGTAGITLFSILTALFLGIGWSHQGVTRRTAYALLARPVPRRAVLWGAYLGMAWIQFLVLALMAAGWRLILMLASVPWSGELTATLLLLYVEVLLVTALAFFLSTVASPALAGATSAVLLLVGYTSRDLRDLAGRFPGVSLRWFSDGAYYLLPCFGHFSPGDLGAGQGAGASEYLLAATYGLSYSLVLLTLASMVFSRREFH